MAVKRVRLVLGEHRYLEQVRVDHIRQGKVNQPVGTTERNGRFGSVGGERHQPFTFAAGEDEGKDLGFSHDQNLGHQRTH